jgi:hypothetical protein
MTTLKNLTGFWAVLLPWNKGYEIFLTESEAENAIKEYKAQALAEFEKWERGEDANIYVQSNLEADLDGGCYQSYSIHPICLPGGMYWKAPKTEELKDWENSEGFNKVPWGCSATIRQTKTTLQLALEKCLM